MNCSRYDVVLSVNLLSKTFHLHEQDTPIEAFMRVSFQVFSGVVTTLTGPSGSGKSSVLKCIYRTYRPTAGSILLLRSGGGWVNLASASDDALVSIRKWEIGFVTQYLHCIPRQSALLVASRPLIDRGIPRDEAADQVSHLFRRLCLPENLWRIPPATMSGGERQKVNLARGILSGTRLLMLDEAVASLDPHSTELALHLILDRRDAGVGVLAIFHNPEHVDCVAGFSVALGAAREPS